MPQLAYGAVNQVLNYIQFPAISISIAASIFAAQAIGAGKSDLLARVTRTALGMNFLFTVTLIALGYLFSKYLMALFITDPTVGGVRATAFIYCTLGNFILWCRCHFCINYACQWDCDRTDAD